MFISSYVFFNVPDLLCEKVRECVGRVERLAEAASALPEGECEVLYGRCGFLCVILFLRKYLGDPQLLAGPATELVRHAT